MLDEQAADQGVDLHNTRPNCGNAHSGNEGSCFVEQESHSRPSNDRRWVLFTRKESSEQPTFKTTVAEIEPPSCFRMVNVPVLRPGIEFVEPCTEAPVFLALGRGGALCPFPDQTVSGHPSTSTPPSLICPPSSFWAKSMTPLMACSASPGVFNCPASRITL